MSKEPLPEQCPNNEGVFCRRNKCNCETCGWNPKVDARRRELRKGEGTEYDRKD